MNVTQPCLLAGWPSSTFSCFFPAVEPLGHVHDRSRQRDDEFLHRLVGNPLEPRDAADRQQRDIGGLDAVPTSGQRVAQLVKTTQPNREDEPHPLDRRPGTDRAARGRTPPRRSGSRTSSGRRSEYPRRAIRHDQDIRHSSSRWSTRQPRFRAPGPGRRTSWPSGTRHSTLIDVPDNRRGPGRRLPSMPARGIISAGWLTLAPR